LKRLKWSIPVLCLSLFFIPNVASAYTIKCWKAAKYDKDNDGYAEHNVNTNKRVSLEVSQADRMTCPVGYVKKRGDCNDNNSNIHPRRPETAHNGIDDNCDGRTDEPIFYYGPNGFDNHTKGFSAWLMVNDAQVKAVWKNKATKKRFFFLNSWLSYRIEYQKLKNTGVTYTSDYESVDHLYTYVGSPSWTKVDLAGLSSGTVYRARVQFYKTFMTFAAPTHVPVGAKSDWYYSATKSLGALTNVRSRVVRRAFYNRFLSETYSFIGYRGTYQVDGTRYGAEVGELWCSEYYSGVVSPSVVDMGHRSNINALDNYFSGFNAFYDMTSQTGSSNTPSKGYTVEDVILKGRHGDYFALDTGLDGTRNHSAMFLAYDTYTQEFWTVEGNTDGWNPLAQSDRRNRQGGNESAVKTRIGQQVHGWGRLKLAMVPMQATAK
jgi:hypothetical protein